MVEHLALRLGMTVADQVSAPPSIGWPRAAGVRSLAPLELIPDLSLRVIHPGVFDRWHAGCSTRASLKARPAAGCLRESKQGGDTALTKGMP
ncbi:MAG: hypothetical protein ACRDJN_12765 [Chloroflexota bacterium]